ncbi:MAG: hypothetical protein WED34_18300 [Planctomycetales bacterium]
MTAKRITWLLASAVVLLLIGVIATTVYLPYRSEVEALEELDRLGVFVDWHGPLPDPFCRIHAARSGPNWLRGLMGDHRMGPFDRVTDINLRYIEAKAEIFMLLQRLRSIDSLTTHERTLSKAEVAELRQQFPGMRVEIVPD